MELQPLLAESWKNLNPNTWEIKLRRGVKFHNGEDFTAESVKFTVERAIGSKLNTLAKLTSPPSFGQDVLIVDPYTVRIVTKIPDPMVPSRLAAESMGMAPAKGLADFKEQVRSRPLHRHGPFRLVEMSWATASWSRPIRATGDRSRRPRASCGRSSPTRRRAWPRFSGATST